MPKSQLELIKGQIQKEPYANYLHIKIIDLQLGYSVVSMEVAEEFDNLFSITHGGAIFSLVDVAFGAAANSYGYVTVALSMSINYIAPATAGTKLIAEAEEISRRNRTATYSIKVKKDSGKIVAVCQATAYIKSQKLPFLDKIEDNS